MLFLLLFNAVGVSFRLLLVVGCLVHVFSDNVGDIIGRVGECMGRVVSVSGNRIIIGARKFCGSLEAIPLECGLVTVLSEDINCIMIRGSWFVVIDNVRGNGIKIGAVGT